MFHIQKLIPTRMTGMKCQLIQEQGLTLVQVLPVGQAQPENQFLIITSENLSP